MKLYYSGAQAFWNQQVKSNLSLGGWISNSPIPNSLAGNIFGNVSLLTIERKLPEYRLIVLKNELAVDVTDILLHFVYPATFPFCKYEVAIVQPSGSADSYYFESIDNIYTGPIYITGWTEADGLLNEINIGNLLINTFLGIWIKRTILPEVDNYFTEDAIIVNYKADPSIEIPVTDLTQLKFSWTE